MGIEALIFFLRERHSKKLLGILLEVSLSHLKYLPCNFLQNIHPYSYIGLWSRRWTQKKIYLGFDWISGEVCEIPNVETHNAQIERLVKRSYAKWNDQLLSLIPQKININPTHQNISLQSRDFIMKDHKYIGFGR